MPCSPVTCKAVTEINSALAHDLGEVGVASEDSCGFTKHMPDSIFPYAVLQKASCQKQQLTDFTEEASNFGKQYL